jgi:hypothetical protein
VISLGEGTELLTGEVAVAAPLYPGELDPLLSDLLPNNCTSRKREIMKSRQSRPDGYAQSTQIVFSLLLPKKRSISQLHH